MDPVFENVCGFSFKRNRAESVEFFDAWREIAKEDGLNGQKAKMARVVTARFDAGNMGLDDARECIVQIKAGKINNKTQIPGLPAN